MNTSENADRSAPQADVIAAVERSLSVVRELEPRVRAWAYLDERDCAERAVAHHTKGPLTGLTFGVKDLIDTAGMPTAYGSPIYAGHFPPADAEIVRRIVERGGFVLGKTVTTEFAVMTPGPTTNPWRATHTPGGSSSGSAAAVACGMVDAALGTQTYGSLIRPASFCGVWALKPSRGSVPVAGVKPLAPTFDQIGWYAGSLQSVQLLYQCLTERKPSFAEGTQALFGKAPTIGVLDLSRYAGLEPAVPALMSRFARDAAASGASTVRMNLHDLLSDITSAHHLAASRESADSLKPELDSHEDAVSKPLRMFLAAGRSVSREEYRDALSKLQTLQAAIDKALAAVDILVTPSALGEAPSGLNSTGDPLFCSPWTAIGAPTLNLPGAVGGTGLPVGLQLVARPEQDEQLLAAAQWVSTHVRWG